MAESLTAWLRDRTDAQLAELLRLRPDLALPAPADLATLAGRVGVRTSAQRVIDGLDAFHLAVLAAVTHGRTSTADVVSELAAIPRADIEAAVEHLIELALLWGEPDSLQAVPTVADVLGPHSYEASASSEPPAEVVPREPAELDRFGTTAVLETLRLAEALAELWSAEPPALLRTGGLSVRDLRKSAKALNADEATTALFAEVLYAAGLINATNGVEPVYLPTEEYDAWLVAPAAARWTRLAAAWLSMTRQPSLIGQRGDRDRTITALSPDVERGNAPTLRAQVLDVLASLPPGAAPRDSADVLAALAWRAPRRAHVTRGFAEAILAEADVLGVTAAGGLTGYSRTLRAGTQAVAEQVLADALPTPVDEFLLQPDLTAVVPGPPTPALARELSAVADLESSGGASVFRITEATVRRALDTGRSAGELHAFFAQRSRTPVPQALAYLIDDAARRHGTLRAGVASVYLRCEDEALLDRAVADRSLAGLGLRRIAPTVAISTSPLAKLLETLRAHGYAPAAESSEGEVVALEFEAPRAPTRPPERTFAARMASIDSTTQRMDLVRRIRSGDALTELTARMEPGAARIAAAIPGITSAATMGTLREAIKNSRRVLIGFAEPDGTTSRTTILPISMAGGVVRGHEPDAQGLRSFPLHRVTGVAVLDDPPAE